MISVILPVRNGAPWIRDSVGSLLDQTLPPDEILVGDDASTDGTPDLVEAMGSPLVKVHRTDEHLGISRQCNKLIAVAKGRYLARMDGDDIALPDRFRVQMDYLRQSQVSILGTWARRFGDASTLHANPTSHGDILAKMGLSCPFVNPTVLMDRDRLGPDLQYDPDVSFGEDYAFFSRLRKKAVFANIPKVLLLWRLHKSNAGSDPGTLSVQNQTLSRVRSSIWKECGIELTALEERALDQLVFQPLPQITDSSHLLSAFQKAVRHPEPDRLWAPLDALRNSLAHQWDYYCRVRAWGEKGILPIWWNGMASLGRRRNPLTFTVLMLKSLSRRQR